MGRSAALAALALLLGLAAVSAQDSTSTYSESRASQPAHLIPHVCLLPAGSGTAAASYASGCVAATAHRHDRPHRPPPASLPTDASHNRLSSLNPAPCLTHYLFPTRRLPLLLPEQAGLCVRFQQAPRRHGQRRHPAGGCVGGVGCLRTVRCWERSRMPNSPCVGRAGEINRKLGHTASSA